MKKFMFSAVALVAFSFAGMANTGGEEKIDLKKLEVVKELPCFNQYKKDKAGLLAAGYSENTAEAIATADFEDCLDRTYSIEP